MNENKAWLIALGILGGVVFVGFTLFTLIGVPFAQNTRMVESPQPLINEVVVEETVSNEAGIITEPSSDEGTPVDWQNEEWQVIAEYYSQLPYDLTKAYATRVDSSVSLETFQDWYGRVKFAWARDPHLVAPHTYRFLVNLIEENPSETSLFQVVMGVENGKVKTISAEKLEHGTLSAVTRPGDENQKAWIAYDKGVESVYGDAGQGPFLITSINRNTWSPFGGGSAFMTIDRIEFSKSGEYLTVVITGWEGGSVGVYHFASNSQVHGVSSPLHYTFDPEGEAWFAECQGSGMDEGYVRVHDLPNWSIRYEYARVPDEAIGDCSITADSEILFSTMTYNFESGVGKERTWRYDIVNDRLSQVE